MTEKRCSRIRAWTSCSRGSVLAQGDPGLLRMAGGVCSLTDNFLMSVALRVLREKIAPLQELLKKCFYYCKAETLQ